MKFRVERDVLAEAVTWTARSLPTRPPLPVLAGLLIEADEKRLTLSSFDYEVSARVEIPAEVSEPGKALGVGPAAGRNHPEPAGASGRSRHRGNRSQGGASPVVPRASRCRRCRARTTRRCRRCQPRPARLPGNDFAAAVAQVAVAAGRDDTLPVLTGIRIEFEGDQLVHGGDRPLSPRDSRVAVATQIVQTSVLSRLVQGRSLAETARALGDSDVGHHCALRRWYRRRAHWFRRRHRW